MSDYDNLLKTAREEAARFRTKASEYVPRMYEALRAEGLDPKDAKDRIEKDLVGIWEKDTIRRLIPDEAKNQGQSEAARKVNKEKAGKNPTSNPKGDRVIEILTDGSEVLSPNSSTKESDKSNLPLGSGKSSQEHSCYPENNKGNMTSQTPTAKTEKSSQTEESSNIVCKVYSEKFASVFAVLKKSKKVCHFEFSPNFVLVSAWDDSGGSKGAA